MLAAQIEQGLKPDVFASANLKLPRTLAAKGLVGFPVRFAANRLVIARPVGGAHAIERLADLARPGVKIAIGSSTVPVGEYTRTFLSRLAPPTRRAILANVRDEEPDVSGIVGKLTAGAVDAGFTYLSDVTATRGALRAIALPARLTPPIEYGAAIVTGAQHRAAAREFIAGLLHGAGREQLLAAGFLTPPTATRRLIIR
jgi:molybdate transport system substrate-binding protein